MCFTIWGAFRKCVCPLMPVFVSCDAPRVSVVLVGTLPSAMRARASPVCTSVFCVNTSFFSPDTRGSIEGDGGWSGGRVEDGALGWGGDSVLMMHFLLH